MRAPSRLLPNPQVPEASQTLQAPQASKPSEAAARAESYLSGADLARVVGITAAALDGLVRVGVVEATMPGGDEFFAATAIRLKRILRLHHDLELDLFGAAVVVDVLERLERVEAELIRLRGGRETREG